jgi:hypothetical protein
MKFVTKAAIGGLLWLTFGAAMFGDTYRLSQRTMGTTPEPEAVMIPSHGIRTESPEGLGRVFYFYLPYCYDVVCET